MTALMVNCQNQPASLALAASAFAVDSQGSATVLCSAAVLCRGPSTSAFAACNSSWLSRQADPFNERAPACKRLQRYLQVPGQVAINLHGV